MPVEPEVRWPASPYKGLGYYTGADTSLFAGREDDVLRCAAEIAEWRTRLLLLHGPTACGKSSFLRAGMIPWLEGAGAGIEFARSGEPGRSSVMFIRCTAEPLAKLADAIFQFTVHDVELTTPIGPCPLHLHEAVPSKLRDQTEFRREAGIHPEVLISTLQVLTKKIPQTLVLIIDQGEEVLTVDPSTGGEKSRAIFFDFLLQFMQAQLDLKLIIALRTEYFGRFVSLSRRGLRGTGITEYFLGDLSDAQVIEAIKRPTLRHPVGRLSAPHDFYRFDFEEGVVESLVQEIGRSGGKLPALQIVCSRLYDEAIKRPQPWRITHNDLEESQGVKGEIERFVDDQIFACGALQGLRPVECGVEVERWKKALFGLVRAQPDGTVTTDLKPETALRDDLSGSRLQFDQAVERLTSDEVRLLRKVTVVSGETQDLISCYGLGHDILGLVLRNWRVRSDSQRRLQTPQLADETPDPDITFNPKSDTALCLSSGGYRALLFHTGVLWRLNELGYLPRIARFSAVSAGSIAAGVLGAGWSKLHFDSTGMAENFVEVVVAPIRRLAELTIDVGAVVRNVFRVVGFGDAAVPLADSLRKHLFGNLTLQDLPDDPRFVFSATNLQSGVLFRFSKPYLSDYRIGRVQKPTLQLAVAIAASAAMPPVLSPARIKLREADWVPGSGTDMQHPPYTEDVHLADGGVYDQLGLEVAWNTYRTILISDAGRRTRDPAKISGRDWLAQVSRVIDIVEQQKRALRRRQIINSFEEGQKLGAYWSIHTELSVFGLKDSLPADPIRVRELAAIPSRFAALEEPIQERLVNWGYAVCDAAFRRNVERRHPPPVGFPYSRGV